MSVKGDQEIILPKYYRDQYYACQAQIFGKSAIDITPVTIISNASFKINIYGYNGSTITSDRIISYLTIGKWK